MLLRTKKNIETLFVDSRILFYQQIWFLFHNKFFGSLVSRGRKLFAFNRFVKIKFHLKKSENFDPYYLFLVAMMNACPEVLLKSIKLGSSKLGIGVPISLDKRASITVKWFIKSLKDKNKTRAFKLSKMIDLIIDTLYLKGDAIKRKIAYHQTASDNRYLLFKFFR